MSTGLMFDFDRSDWDLDPVTGDNGHESAQTMRNCPVCFAEPGEMCHNRSGNPTDKSHHSR